MSEDLKRTFEDLKLPSDYLEPMSLDIKRPLEDSKPMFGDLKLVSDNIKPPSEDLKRPSEDLKSTLLRQRSLFRG